MFVTEGEPRSVVLVGGPLDILARLSPLLLRIVVTILGRLSLLLAWLVRHACSSVRVRWLVHEFVREPGLIYSVIRRAWVLRWLLSDIS